MKIDVYASHTHVADKDIRGKQCVVIDTLRATSVIVTALSNGCKQVVPVAEVDQAMELKATMGTDAILGGERNALKVPGFDLGNSPLEYTTDVVAAKTVILTTTNGTQAIQKAQSASNVLIGSMINGVTVASALMRAREDAVILCAGTKGRFSLDDILTAGYIIYRMRRFGAVEPIETDDLGTVCEQLYIANRDHLVLALENARHFHVLVEAGMKKDVLYCMKRDIVHVLPRLNDGRIALD